MKTTQSSCSVLITGGAGFIGSHLAESYLKDGWSVVVLDDLSTGSVKNVAEIRRHPRFRMVVGSVLDVALVGELVDEADVVIHLAAAVGVRLVIEKPIHTIETNVGGTETVLRACAKKGKRTFVASTSEVYGKSEAIPFREDGDLLLGATMRHRWLYACSKALDEFLALSYGKTLGVPVTVGRLFNTVGPRQTGRYGMVVPRLVWQALAGHNLTVYGDGKQTRCFTHVLDVVDAIRRLIESHGCEQQVFNIGSEEEVSIMDLARLIVDLTGSTSRIETVPYDVAYGPGFEDMPRRVPAIDKIRDTVAWTPRRSLREIVTDVASDITRTGPVA